MNKKLLLIAILFSFVVITFAANPTQYLVRIDRNALAQNQKAPDQAILLQKLSASMSILYASKNYILVKTDDKALTEIPQTTYSILDSYPLDGNWYLLTMLRGKANLITSEMGKEITRMDQTILLQSNLSDIPLAKISEMPIVRLGQDQIRFNHQDLMNSHPTTRVDFGNLLNQVNADSITWFIQNLQNFNTRYAHASNRLAVANWIKNQFLRFGINNAHTEAFVVDSLDQYNVVATIPGTLAPNKYIVVGGHHDSIVLDGNNSLFTAPGADDNASGTAAALEIARIMKANNYQPECSIRFVTFACEEFGLFGSDFNAQSAEDQGLDIKLMINHDMISTSFQTPESWNVNLNIYEGAIDYAILASSVTEAQTTLTPMYWYYNTSGSDSYSYWQHGYPAVYFDEHDFSPNYHTITDVVANINPQFVKEVIKASTAMTVTVDQMPSKISDIQIVDTGTGNSLQANWNTQDLESDVVSFKVYSRLVSQEEPAQYTTSSTSFIVPNLVADSTYYIGVAAIDSDGNEGLTYYVTGVPCITPQVPVGFIDMPVMHAVNFDWIPNPELDIAGYRLYRSTSLDGTYSPVNNNLVTSTSYTDNTVQDITYYYYKLVTVDTDNHESLPTAVIRSRALTLNQGILIVDETRNNSGNTVFAPNDVVSDQFFDSVLHDFTRTQFDTERDGTLKLADIGIYSSIFWHGNDAGNMSYPYLVRGEIIKYIQAGGKIMISSYLPSQAFDNNDVYPVTFEAGNYFHDGYGIQNAAYINQARFKYALPQSSGFPALTVDTLKTLNALHGHIFTIESVGATASAQNIYYYGSDYSDSTSQGSMNGMPVGVYYQYESGAKTIVLSFPLFNMYQPQVETLMNYVFRDLFNEPVGIEDPVITPSAGLFISKVYPNPFNGSVNLEIRQTKASQPLNVSIYNVKGQKVKTLFSGISKDRINSLNWDGKDEQGNSVSNSIYFIKAEQAGKAVSRKIIKLN